jgi:hypothetical protein
VRKDLLLVAVIGISEVHLQAHHPIASR